jgi:S1-C subfamily serine protease
LVIGRLSSRGIFAKAKFREGDIIVSINGNRVRSQDDFFHWFHGGARQRVPIVVLRDDREATLYVEPEVIHEERAPARRGGAWLGVDLVDRFHNQAMVLKVHPNSPAERAGIRPDDVILSVEGEEITSPDHLGQVIGGMRPGTEVEIQVDRDRRLRVMDAVLGQRSGAAQSADVGPELIPPRPEASTPPPPPPQFEQLPPPPREGRQPQRQERRGGLLRPLFQRR